MAATRTTLTLISFACLMLAVMGNLCEEYGECGLNGICKLDGDFSNCTCPPGFHFLHPQNTSNGCTQNAHNQQRLHKCSGSSSTAEMQYVGRFDWSGNDYQNINPINKTACQQECLRDCFCTVAIYSDSSGVGNCWKKALPLRDGRASSTRMAFVKLYNQQSIPPRRPQVEIRKGIVVVSIGISLMGLCLAIAVLLMVLWISSWRPKMRFLEQGRYSDGLKAFSFGEIERATQGFKQVLGRGSFGKVYKGVLPDGRAIAVKKLEYKQGAEVGSQIGDKEFRTEMIVIGSSHHRNLVQLYGFCNEGSNRILVYEYMPNGSLDRVLFQSEKSHLDWDLRVKIVLGTARGILYLHEEWGTRIVHCDIKPQNILLDENYSAKLSDFGIAKLMVGSEQTRTFTEARGTMGYMAPEWRTGMAISVKVDVYSFGVMLLEIICCRKMAKLGVPENEIVLSEWAYDCLKLDGGVLRLVENQCTSGINERELERMVLIGLWCVQEDPCLRPSIKAVVQMLEGTNEISVPPRPGVSSQVSISINL